MPFVPLLHPAGRRNRLHRNQRAFPRPAVAGTATGGRGVARSRHLLPESRPGPARTRPAAVGAKKRSGSIKSRSYTTPHLFGGWSYTTPIHPPRSSRSELARLLLCSLSDLGVGGYYWVSERPNRLPTAASLR